METNPRRDQMEIIHKALADDLTGREDETVASRRFSVEGTDYEIDLSDENWLVLQMTLDQYITHARPLSPRRPRSRSKAVRGQSADIRRWAQEQNLPVSENGRLPGSVKRQYEAAHAA